jgi:CheY-like chemotaxis protein
MRKGISRAWVFSEPVRTDRPGRKETMTPLRILIAEDDAVIAMYLSQILVAMGHEICASTREQAETVMAAALHAPDLMIVDEGLRDGSGVLAMAEILKTGFVRHIFATGDCYRVLKAEPQAVVLQKPFSTEALSALQLLATPG